jgi:hypothetical protein
MFIQTSEHTSRWGRSLKYGRLREGPPEPKGKIQNPENFAPGVPKRGIENAMFKLYGRMYKVYHT